MKAIVGETQTIRSIQSLLINNGYWFDVLVAFEGSNNYVSKNLKMIDNGTWIKQQEKQVCDICGKLIGMHK